MTTTTGSSQALAVRGQPDEVRALTRLAFEEISGIPAGIGGIHMAVADRVFRWVGPAARRSASCTTRLRAASTALCAAARTFSAAASTGLRPRCADPESHGRSRPRVRAASPSGSSTACAATRWSGRAARCTSRWRCASRAIRWSSSARRSRPPSPRRPRGSSCSCTASWRQSSRGAWERGGDDDTYGARLASELGCTPVYVRYNSGRHISENGRSLAELLAALVDEWPVDVAEIALVGHSMGGLVSRSACHQAAQEQMEWTRSVRHVVSLGSPHMGAPLEQGVHYLSAALHALPETRPFGAFLRRRSAGIRDLRAGLAGRRGLARPRPRRAARRRVPGGAAARWRDPLLRRGHDHAQRQAPAGAAGRRLPRARAERLGAQPHAPDPVQGRARPARRRRQPLRAAQPPRGLRASVRDWLGTAPAEWRRP